MTKDELLNEQIERGDLWQLRAQAMAVALKRLGHPDVGQGIMQMTDKQTLLSSMNRGPTLDQVTK